MNWFNVVFGLIRSGADMLWANGGVGRVLKFARARGWEPLIIDRFESNSDKNTALAYVLRYRDADSSLHECIVRSPILSDIELERSQKIPEATARGMYDLKRAMDCVRCGSTVPVGTEQCPYCRRWRDELIIS